MLSRPDVTRNQTISTQKREQGAYRQREALIMAAEKEQKEFDHHGWINTEMVKTRFGNFEFKKGYPTLESAEDRLDRLMFNRAIEVYLTQMPAVSIKETRRGLRKFGAKNSNQVVIWEQLMDAQTLVLTPNTETVYAMGFLD